MAHSLIYSELATKVLLINADTYSKYISPKDRSTRVLFGDGAAATIVEKDTGKGMIDVDFTSDGGSYDCFYIPAGGCRLPSRSSFVQPFAVPHSSWTIVSNGSGTDLMCCYCWGFW